MSSKHTQSWERVQRVELASDRASVEITVDRSARVRPAARLTIAVARGDIRGFLPTNPNGGGFRFRDQSGVVLSHGHEWVAAGREARAAEGLRRHGD